MARTYGLIPLTTWHLEAQKVAKADPEGGKTTLLLYAFLRTAPGSTAIGMYCKGIPVIAYESTLSKDEVERGLKTLESLRLVFYDAVSGTVSVPAVSDELVPRNGQFSSGANMLESIRTTLEEMRRLESAFVLPFVQRYAHAFHLQDLQAILEEETEIETEEETEIETETAEEIESEREPSEGPRDAVETPSEGRSNGPISISIPIPVPVSGSGSGSGPGEARAREAQARLFEKPPPEDDPASVFGWLECKPDKKYPEGRRFAVTESRICEWRQNYPGLDIDGLIRDLIQWSCDKKREAPSRLPKYRGAARFFVNAFKRHESQGGNRVLRCRLERHTRRSF